MAGLSLRPDTVLIDTKTGKPTREMFLFLSELGVSINDATSEFVRLTAAQTLTNKTIDGDTNTLQDIATASLKTKTGTGKKVVTSDGAGTSGNLVKWDADGDLGEYTAAQSRTHLGLVIGTNVQAWDADLDAWAAKTAPSGTVVGTTDTQSLSNKDFTNPPVLPTYTVATVPNVATFARGLIYVSNETGGATVAFSDGTNWRRVQDRAVVS